MLPAEEALGCGRRVRLGTQSCPRPSSGLSRSLDNPRQCATKHRHETPTDERSAGRRSWRRNEGNLRHNDEHQQARFIRLRRLTIVTIRQYANDRIRLTSEPSRSRARVLIYIILATRSSRGCTDYTIRNVYATCMYNARAHTQHRTRLLHTYRYMHVHSSSKEWKKTWVIQETIRNLLALEIGA